jgi:DNA-binding transcriptional regulator LsrR (DeoR family)
VKIATLYYLRIWGQEEIAVSSALAQSVEDTSSTLGKRYRRIFHTSPESTVRNSNAARTAYGLTEAVVVKVPGTPTR